MVSYIFMFSQSSGNMPDIIIVKKSVPLQASTDPEGSIRLRLPDFKTMGRLYPGKYSWYSFLLEAESTSGP
jgi:hypothetical protein